MKRSTPPPTPGPSVSGLLGADDAQAQILSVVLLLGLVAVGMTGVLLVGGHAQEDLRHSIDDERAKSILVHVDGKVDSVAASSESVRTIHFSRSASSEAADVGNDGRIVVRKRNLSETTTVIDRPLGTVKLETRRKTYAYQGGAVWEVSDAGTTMVSSPAMSYRNGDRDDDATLTVPVTTFRGSADGDGVVTLTKNRSGSTLRSLTVDDSEQVVVTVTSDYYRGWADYYRREVGDDAVAVDHATNTVTVVFGRRGTADTFDRAISSTGTVTLSTSGTVEGSIIADEVRVNDGDTLQCSAGSGSDCYSEDGGPTYVAMDEVISERMTEAAGDPSLHASINSTGSPLTNGTYYVGSDVLLRDELAIDVGTGNVTLLVDGDTALDNERISVVNGSGTSNVVRVYTTGDVAIGGGDSGVTVASGEAKRFQLYGTSGMEFALGQASHGFTGVVYAPQDDGDGFNDAVDLANLDSAESACEDSVRFCLGQGNTTFTGALVGGATEVGQSVDVTYDEDLASVSPTPPTLGERRRDVSHLHVSVGVVTVE